MTVDGGIFLYGNGPDDLDGGIFVYYNGSDNVSDYVYVYDKDPGISTELDGAP